MKNMKRLLFSLGIVAILVVSVILTGCGGDETTQPTGTTTQPTGTTTQPTQTTTTEPTGMQPQYGGTLRAIAGAIPKVIGWPPEKAPSDTYYMLPVLERLAEWDTDGSLKPMLCSSWDLDTNAKTITWHLQQGVNFHDGTPFDAEALRWNFQLQIDNASLTASQFIDSMDVLDEYTLRLNMSRVDWQTINTYSLMQPISPTAFETAGGTIPAGSDEEASIEWARSNVSGTGPFTVSEWVRDDHITYVKNPNYWRKDDMGNPLPYLDAIEMRYIPDPLVAAASLEAGEADIWMETNSVDNILDLESKGFSVNRGPGMFNLLLMSSADPDNPLSIKEVREAIEYALDRPAMAQTLGQGLYEPLHQMASSSWPGYVEGYDPRPYDPDIARQLLTDAGFPSGFKMQIMATSTGADAMALLQYYLGEVNIEVEPDIADLGRYFGAVFGTGWQDAVLTASGINPDATDLFVHFGPNPVTFDTTNIWKSDAFKQLCDEALAPGITSGTEALPKIREAVRQAGEDAIFIPLWRSINACIYAPYVHTEYIKIHGITWDPWFDWMEQQ